MFFAVLPVLAIKDGEIAYVVGENGSLPTHSIFKLIRIGFAGALQLQNMHDIVAPLSKNLCENGSRILIE